MLILRFSLSDAWVCSSMPDLELLLVNTLPGAAYQEHANTALWVGVALALLGLLCMLALTWLPNILLLHQSTVVGSFQFKKIHAKASGYCSLAFARLFKPFSGTVLWHCSHTL